MASANKIANPKVSLPVADISGTVYDLSGRMMPKAGGASMPEGLYIVNGKKVARGKVKNGRRKRRMDNGQWTMGRRKRRSEIEVLKY